METQKCLISTQKGLIFLLLLLKGIPWDVPLLPLCLFYPMSNPRSLSLGACLSFKDFFYDIHAKDIFFSFCKQMVALPHTVSAPCFFHLIYPRDLTISIHVKPPCSFLIAPSYSNVWLTIINLTSPLLRDIHCFQSFILTSNVIMNNRVHICHSSVTQIIGMHLLNPLCTLVTISTLMGLSVGEIF